MVEVNLPMEVALQRGPLVYCGEWVDNDGKVSNLIIPSNTTFSTEYKADLLNGVTVLKSNIPAIVIDDKGQT